MSMLLGAGPCLLSSAPLVRSWYGYRGACENGVIIEDTDFRSVYRACLREIRNEAASESDADISTVVCADLEYGLEISTSNDGFYWKSTWFPMASVCRILATGGPDHVEVYTERRS